jgi:hypothetical protein
MTGSASAGFDPFRPPMIGAATWQAAMLAAGWQCECTGECGKTHAKTQGRCGVAHGSAHPLAVVAADPAATLRAAVSGTDLVALCASCQTAIKRAATKAAEAAAAARTDQLDLLDLTGGSAA